MKNNDVQAIANMLAYITENHSENSKFMTIVKTGNDEYRCYTYDVNDNINNNLIANFENLNIYSINNEVVIHTSKDKKSYSKAYLNNLLKYLSEEEYEKYIEYKGNCLSQDDFIFYDIDELCVSYIKSHFKQSYMNYLSNSFYAILKNKLNNGN